MAICGTRRWKNPTHGVNWRKGQKADLYLSQVKAAFAAILPDGMSKLATAMANADASGKSPTRLVSALIEQLEPPPKRLRCALTL